MSDKIRTILAAIMCVGVLVAVVVMLVLLTKSRFSGSDVSDVADETRDEENVTELYPEETEEVYEETASIEKIPLSPEIESLLKEWNIWEPEKEEVPGSAFTYNIYPSVDNTKAWIYNIEVDEKMDSSKLDIPSTINGRTVTRLGWVNVPRNETFDEEYDEFLEADKTIFGAYVEWFHELPGYCKAASEIKNMIIPKTVTDIQESAFSGMENLESVTIPDGVSVISEYLFYGNNSMKSVYLPANVTTIAASAFDDCKELQEITIPSECSTFKMMDKCIVKKGDNSLIFCYASGKEYNIPEGINILKENSFTGCYAEKVHIPASVNQIEGWAFSRCSSNTSEIIHEVTVSDKNPVYAKDGKTIYNKNDKTLSIAMISYDKKSDTYSYDMSDKVERLTDQQNMVSINKFENHIEKLYVSKNLKTVGMYGWGVVHSAYEVIFQNEKAPVLDGGEEEADAKLPVFATISVPKAANDSYRKLYKKTGDMEYVDKWVVY